MAGIQTIEDIWTRSIPEPNSGCWLWMRHVSPNGYATARIDTVGTYAHRVAYELTYGAIPEGLEIDHLCRVRCCVNPAHLEVVTNLENKMRGKRRIRTHCKRGHPMIGDNIVWDARGRRHDCRECNRLRLIDYKANRKTTP